MPDATLTSAQPKAQSLSRLGSLWTLYTLTLRQHLHGRRWIALAMLFMLPFLLAVLVRLTAPRVPPEALEFMLIMMFVPMAVLPIAALLYASGIIQDEQEEQTITYLLLRPIPKWAIYLVKLLAAMTTTTVLVVVFTGLTYAACYINTETPFTDVVARWLKASAIHSLAVTTYCSLFGLISLLTNRVLVVGILYTAVVEGLLASFPFSIRLVTVIYYARLIAYRTMSFQVPRPGRTPRDIAASTWQFDARQDPSLLTHPQVSTCILVLLGATIVFAAIAAWLCSQREFHVKTPEKE
jgi:ABC-2 type transport system permease protein